MIPSTVDAHNYLELENLKYPETLVKIPRKEWPNTQRADSMGVVEVWRSRAFLVQVYKPANGAQRLSVNRTVIDGKGRWKDGITWDELQDIKRQTGRGGCFAVEIYPEDSEVVNVGNMRHLWVMSQPLPFAWRGGK